MDLNKSAPVFANIHCFLCVAKHSSFTEAAKELCLTQSAISYRIRKLEKDLGLKLFQRFTRKLLLTQEGERLLAIIEPSVKAIDSELHSILDQKVGGALNITVTPSFANCWFIPRLYGFWKKHPNIQINLRTRTSLVDFGTEAVDIAIYYGIGHHPGLQVTPFMKEEIFPVCSPHYADEHKLRQKPKQLKNCRFLHDAMQNIGTHDYSEWETWLEAAGIQGLNLKNSYTFDRSDLAVSSAIEGLGVAIGRHCLIQRNLSTGELVAPFDIRCSSLSDYYIICSKEKYHTPRLKVFMNWLMDQASVLNQTKQIIKD